MSKYFYLNRKKKLFFSLFETPLRTGIITDKNVLPITRLNFGRTLLETSSGIHTLGRFECTGSVALNGFPTSCEDLWLIGHTLNGFYSVKGNKMIESVYCDFTQLPSEAGKLFKNNFPFINLTILHNQKDFRNGLDMWTLNQRLSISTSSEFLHLTKQRFQFRSNWRW